MIAHSSIVGHLALTLAITVATTGYVAAWSGGRRRKSREYWSFGTAGLLMLLVTSPRFERLADRSFSWHMAQHLVLMAVVAPLFLVARPVTVLAQGWPAWGARMRRAGVAGAGRRVGVVPRTLVALAVLLGVHAGRAYDAALANRWLHDLQHVAFVGAGALLWSIAIGGATRRAPKKIAAAFGASAALTLLSLWIMALDDPLSEHYADRVGASRAVDDQRTGAALMWVGMVSLTVPLLIAIVWQWAATEQRIAERAEAIDDRT